MVQIPAIAAIFGAALRAVLGLDDLEVQSFQNPPSDFPHHAGIVDNQTRSHCSLLPVRSLSCNQ
jgi:hypothetical protein